jgi:hypothetical protein
MGRRHILVVLAGLLVAAVPAPAHHSFVAEFDATKLLKLHGTVTKFDFINPHGWIYADVKNADGTVAHWSFETGNPSMLLRRGWKKDSLKPGDEISIEAYQARDGSNTANARQVVRADGEVLFNGNAPTDESSK